jgi:trk system potassium uptake protein TrkA
LTYFSGMSATMRGSLGIDMVISPDRTTADDMASALLLPGAVSVELFADRLITVAEVIAGTESPAIGRSFGELRTLEGVTVAGVARAGQLSIAYDESVVEKGDHMFVVAESANARRIVGKLAGHAITNKQVMIYGASKVGMHLSRRLVKARRRVTLIEPRIEVANFAADRLSDVLVLHADGADRSVLQQEGVGDIDAFVAASENDASNLLTALTARQLGARSAIATVSRSGYLPLVDVMGIDAVFSPRMHTADAILRYVRRGSVERLHQFTTGAEMLEFHASDSCDAIRAPLRELGLPRNCIVCAIVRDNEVLYPRGNALVQGGDKVIVLAQPDAISDVEQVFEG